MKHFQIFACGAALLFFFLLLFCFFQSQLQTITRVSLYPPQVTCRTCNYKSNTVEPFWDLSLEFPERYHSLEKGLVPVQQAECMLTEMLAKFTETEALEGRIYACDQCNSEWAGTVPCQGSPPACLQTRPGAGEISFSCLLLLLGFLPSVVLAPLGSAWVLMCQFLGVMCHFLAVSCRFLI